MRRLLLLLSVVALICSCSRQYEIPDSFTSVQEEALIYPDYTNAVIPVNIAPLDFQLQNECDEVVVSLWDNDGNNLIAGAGEDRKLMFDEDEWHKLLNRNQGRQISVSVYSAKDGNWVKYPDFGILVADSIDSYLSYRLLDPSYDFYDQMGIYQRNLENFDQVTVYENNRDFDVKENHCINCHNYQNHDTQHMMFHVRGAHGCTVFINDGKIDRRKLRSDSILANAVYPSWHPTRPWLAFSSNITKQYFHMEGQPKVEVFDEASDLIFYDYEKGELRNVLKTQSDLETFPCWNTTGDRLFYCRAHVPALDSIDVSKGQTQAGVIRNQLLNLRYDIMSIPFDVNTQTFGTPEVEVPCVEMGKSASVPRMSPDGRYLLFSLADWGQFHIWQNSSDLYVKNMETGSVYPLKALNSPAVDSYHSWSSNGRWIVFSSRRDDGIFTRLYISYFDKYGKAHKPFLLPQRDPQHNLYLQKSYNVPELTVNSIPVSFETLKKEIYSN